MPTPRAAARGQQRGSSTSVGELDQLVQARRRRPTARACGSQRASASQQRLAALLVAQAHAPHVPVELAAGDEVAQRELPDDLRAAVLDRLHRDQLPRQPRRHQHPAEAHAGGQALAGRADVAALARARVPAARRRRRGRSGTRRRSRPRRSAARSFSAHSISAARRSALSTAAGGELVRGRDDDGHAPSVRASAATPQALLVDGDWRDARSPACSAISRCTCQPGSSTRDRARCRGSPASGRASEKPCMKPVHTSMCSGSAAAPRARAEVVGERFAQLRDARGVAVAERVERRLAPGRAQRAQPAVAGKAREVGQAGVEVVGGSSAAASAPARRGAEARTRVGDPHRRALARRPGSPRRRAGRRPR